VKRAALRKSLDRQSEQQRYFISRVRRLPAMLEVARHKVRMLENEARRYGLNDLLGQNPAQDTKGINHV
jgi:hypothetical protein